MEVQTMFTLIAVPCVTLFYLFEQTGIGRFVYQASKIPGPSIWEVLTVHAKNLLSDDMLNYACKVCAQYGHKPWGAWLSSDFVLFISDCETVGEVAKCKSMTNKPGLFYDVVSQYLGNGLLNMNGLEYKYHKRILSSAFRKKMLESGLPMINDEAAALVRALEEKDQSKSVDLLKLLEDQVLQVALRLFSSDKYVYPNKRYFCETAQTAMELIQLRATNPWYYWLIERTKKSTKDAESRVEGLIDDVRNVFLKNKDFLKGVCDEEFGEEDFSDEEILGSARHLLTAAFDTTSSTINFCLLLLALHPEIQVHVFNEVEAIVGRTDRSLRAEDVAKMTYLEMVIKETLRLFPPVPMVARKVEESTNINNMSVPNGATVVVNIMALHRSPDVYKHPLKFEPERFSPEVSEKRDPYAFIPFSFGTRTCLGQLQAYTIIKIFMCHILRRFKVLPGDGLESVQSIKIKMAVHTHLREPLRLYLLRRKT